MTAPAPRSLVLDGGLATLLEQLGADLSGSLWSAEVLRRDPSLVTRAHGDFFAAGAQVATTATYQLTPMSLSRSGVDAKEFEPLTRSAVSAAREARDAHGAGWVVGSIGPYGAALADGSEYTGDYDLPPGDEGIARLRDHHRARIVTLVEAGVDALAVETLPTAAELEAVVAELNSLGATLPAWFSFTPAAGGATTRTGEPLSTLGQLAAGYGAALALGVNCCPPDDVAPALRALDPAAHGLTGVAYPNSGETWDARARQWRGEAHWDDTVVVGWRAAGATLVGGCCRVFPDQISALARA